MKKIYLLSFILLFGKTFVFSGTAPKLKTDPHFSRNSQNAISSSESAGNLRVNLNHQSGGNKIVNHTVSRLHNPGNSSLSLGCIYSDNFDGLNDTTSLQARGYKTYYRGTGPQGTSAAIWYQGSTVVFNSYNGPADGYVASNYNSVDSINNIDNWLVLPALNLHTGDALSFYSQSPLASPNPDSLHVWYSAVGDSTPEDTSWVLLGEFQVNVSGIWEYKSFTVPADGINGRLAIRYAVVNGGPNGPNSDYVGIDEIDVHPRSATDGKLSAIISPVSSCGLTANEPVTIVIHNIGTNDLSGFSVSFTVDSGTTVVENVSSTIHPGDSLVYTFTATADLFTLGAHQIDAALISLLDSNLCNNNNVQSISVVNGSSSTPLTTAYTMGFEPTEDYSSWAVQDGNGDGSTWAVINTFAHSGDNCMRKSASTSSDDDWLFTGCLEMSAGSSYTLDYWYKDYDSLVCNIESYIGDAQLNTAMTQLIVQDPNPTDTSYHHSITQFAVPLSGTYYLGFHAVSIAGSDAVRIDDINLDNGNSIGIQENIYSRNVSIYPNPNNGLFYLNSHAVAKNITVDVYNLSGQKVYTSRLNNLNQQIIDLSKQVNGVYTIRITSDSFVENHSVILSR